MAYGAVAPLIRPDDILIDEMPAISPSDSPAYDENVIRNLKPGLTELIVHLGYDDAELQAITAGHPNWGAAWRQRDFAQRSLPSSSAPLRREARHLARTLGEPLKALPTASSPRRISPPSH